MIVLWIMLITGMISLFFLPLYLQRCEKRHFWERAIKITRWIHRLIVVLIILAVILLIGLLV